MKKSFVPISKQSKKAQKTYHSAQRSTWGILNPATRTMPNGAVCQAECQFSVFQCTVYLLFRLRVYFIYSILLFFNNFQITFCNIAFYNFTIFICKSYPVIIIGIFSNYCFNILMDFSNYPCSFSGSSFTLLQHMLLLECLHFLGNTAERNFHI